MSKKQNISGGSTAPSELLYAMVLATRAAIENPSDKVVRATCDGLIELVKVAEHLPLSAGEQYLSMWELITAGTGFIGFEGSTPHSSVARIVPEVQEVVLRYKSAQQFLNSYMQGEMGWVFDFSPQPDTQIINLLKAGLQPGSEIT